MEMEKKNVAIIILAIALIASGVGNIILVLQPQFFAEAEERVVLFGNMYIAEDIDPQYSWDSASFDADMMIYESLFKNNLTAPSLGKEMNMMPLLATDLGTYDPTGTILTVNLKSGVKFQDGTDFNADAVVWSFMRLHYLMNTTWNGAAHPWGTLPGTCFYNIPTIVDSLYYVEGVPIIKNVTAVSPTQVKFYLSQPYGVFKALLTFPASAIVSPFSTPRLDYINPAQVDVPGAGNPLSTYGPCIGTGPMMITKLETYEVRFVAFEDYHRPRIGFDVLVHVKIQDSDARNMAVLAGTVDIITDPYEPYFPTMQAEPKVTLLDTGTIDSITQYMGINNKWYNITWRNAFSYAFNYSGVIDATLLGYGVRMKSPVPPGIKFHNDTFNCPTYNLATARAYMQSMGFGVGFTTDAQWAAATFLTINYTYNLGNPVREAVFDIAQAAFDKIGVVVEDAGMTWEDFKDRLYNRRVSSAGYNAMHIWWVGWLPDYNDPENFINPLMSNTSSSNAAQVNDPYLESLMLAGIKETDEDLRKPIYWEIQRYVVEDLRNWLFGYHRMNYDCFAKDLKGWCGNPIAYNDFYGTYWDGLLNPGEYGYMGDGYVPL
ncbi:MAG: ABC transporter substrate-binding protein [Candidatus Odinarchaeota archaeon]